MKHGSFIHVHLGYGCTQHKRVAQKMDGDIGSVPNYALNLSYQRLGNWDYPVYPLLLPPFSEN